MQLACSIQTAGAKGQSSAAFTSGPQLGHGQPRADAEAAKAVMQILEHATPGLLDP